MPQLVLGVDGGNTKTIALVARPDGTILGAGRSGCADIYGAPTPADAIREITIAVTAAVGSAAASVEDVAVAAFSLAGADWPEDFGLIEAELAPLLPGCRAIEVVNDAIGGLRAGTTDGVGVAVVCGTGGCVGARSPEGRVWHSSWWGLHTGGWAIGTDALDAVYAAELGIAPGTTLSARALEVFQAADVEAVLHSFTRRGGRGAFEASLFAPAVLAEAVAGDEVARRVVVAQGAKLGDYARAGARIVGLEGRPYPLVLLGGVLRGAGAELLVGEITARLPDGVRAETAFEPAAGALLLALDAAGGAVDESRLSETFPGPALFTTAE
jgi:N-acetylglucosamine kinase-like BadF-type ATPase